MSKQTKIPKPNNTCQSVAADLGHAAESTSGRSESSRLNADFIQKMKGNGNAGIRAFEKSTSKVASADDQSTFEVKGLPRMRKQRENTIYFERNDMSVSGDQFQRIKDFIYANQNADTIYLYGFSSDEFDSDKRERLALERMNEVKELTEMFSKDKVNFKLEYLPDQGLNHFDYRQYRSVKMSVAPLKFSAPIRGVEGADCNEDKIKLIKQSVKDAKSRVMDTLTKLTSFKRNKELHEDVDQVLMRYFGSSENDVVDSLIGSYTSIIGALENPGIYDKMYCGDLSYKICHTAYAAALSQEGIIFCPKYFEQIEKTFTERILIHEFAHFIPQDLPDLAYAHDRLFRTLSTKENLNNADSIAYFTVAVNNEVAVSKRNTQDSPKFDRFINCSEDDRQRKIENILGRTVRSISLAKSGVRNIYGHENGINNYGPYIEAQFGKFDKVKLAGIVDHMIKLAGVTYRSDFKFFCHLGDPADRDFEFVRMTRSKAIEVSDEFLELDMRKQVQILTAELTQFVRGIALDKKMAYGRITTDFVENYWNYNLY
jgi:hypothetical protein